MEPVNFLFDGWEPIARILVVGSLGYAALVLVLRLGGTRTIARMDSFDMVLTMALGASFGRVLTARNVALAEAITAFALLVSLQYLVSWLRVRIPAFHQAVSASPVMLFYHGRPMEAAMRRERVTEADLRAALREQGHGSFAGVAALVLEPDGQIAVITRELVGDGNALPTFDQQ